MLFGCRRYRAGPRTAAAAFWLVLGLYLRPMTAEFGLSRTDFAAVFSSASIANALMLPVAGYLVDCFGPRPGNQVRRATGPVREEGVFLGRWA